ncbi:MAG: site-specific integrase [Spirochaetes bacterium]|nr:site-specific integrase [Spirochaetota bacterium]
MRVLTKFYLYRRSRKKKSAVYYAKIRKPDGTFGTATCTGESVRSRAAAWASDRFDELNNTPPPPPPAPTLAEFARDFFAWDSPWRIDRDVSGKRVSRRNCIEKTHLLENRIIPELGSFTLNDITTHRLKLFRIAMSEKKLSGSTINKCLIIIRALLNDAADRGIITALPRIENAATKSKERGTLTVDEVKRLFVIPWRDPRGRVAALIASTAGLRASELQGLTHADIHLDDGFIVVSKAWDERMRQMNATTKNGTTRNVFLPGPVLDEVRDLMAVHPSPAPDSFLFYAEGSTGKPCERIIFIRALYGALREIGIGETVRRERNLSFHSLRHFANSLFISSGIPLLKVQAMIGHKSIDMSKRYYHIGVDDMADIRNVQESLFKMQ